MTKENFGKKYGFGVHRKWNREKRNNTMIQKYGSISAGRKKNIISKICPVCNTEFSGNEYKIKKQKYCSNKCVGIRNRGENNPSKRLEVREKIKQQKILEWKNPKSKFNSPEWKLKINTKEKSNKLSKSLTGRKLSNEHRKHCSEAQKKLYKEGYINPAKNISLNQRISKEVNEKRKIKISQTLKKQYKTGTRKINTYFNRWPTIPYKTYVMRSSWEVIFAKWLDSHNLHWTYEPKLFRCKTLNYIPDFFVEEWNSFVEIKGFWYPKALDKINEFKEAYPKLQLKIIDSKEIKSYEI